MAKKQRDRSSKVWAGMMGLVILLALVTVAGWVAYQHMTQPPGTGGSSAGAVQANDNGSTAGGKGNAQYNNAVSQLNKSQAKQAAQSGKSFIPTPVGKSGKGSVAQQLGLGSGDGGNGSGGGSGHGGNGGNGGGSGHPGASGNGSGGGSGSGNGNGSGSGAAGNGNPCASIAQNKGFAPSTEGERECQQYLRQKRSAERQREQHLEQAMLQEFGKLSKRTRPGSPETVVYTKRNPGQEGSGAGGQGNGSGGSQGGNGSSGASGAKAAPSGNGGKSGSTTAKSKTRTLPGDVHIGSVLYAVNDLRLDSDSSNTPAMATVVGGKLDGAKVMGGFKREGGYLVVAFNKLVTKSGKTYSIKGVAVDPNTPQATVRTAINHHYLARWGGLIGASFLSGFGQAVSMTGTTQASSVGNGGSSTLTSHPNYSLRQQEYIAAGKVGQKLSNDMQQQFNEPPTVTLAANQPIGILVTGIQ